LALDAAGMRQQAIAQNIANASTPGYQRIAVSFEGPLAALGEAGRGGATPSLADLSNFQPAYNYVDGAGGVEIDKEVADLSENVLHQHALLKALGKHLALLGIAINEGKR
jgi:flagellar basal-body rod protein FlgB